MKTLLLVMAATSSLLLIVKLFTYEFYLPDDPTSGIALRSEPMLESRMPLRRSAGAHADRIIVQDENEFVGASAYRFTVRIGWLLTPLSATVLAAALLFKFREGQDR